jgi:hypothetical protein
MVCVCMCVAAAVLCLFARRDRLTNTCPCCLSGSGQSRALYARRSFHSGYKYMKGSQIKTRIKLYIFYWKPLDCNAFGLTMRVCLLFAWVAHQGALHYASHTAQRMPAAVIRNPRPQDCSWKRGKSVETNNKFLRPENLKYNKRLCGAPWDYIWGQQYFVLVKNLSWYSTFLLINLGIIVILFALQF